MLKCTCNPSAAAGGMDKVCCARTKNQPKEYLVNLFLTNLVRISGFSSSFPSDRSTFAHFLPENAKNTAIAEKREENPEILTKLVRKRLTR